MARLKSAERLLVSIKSGGEAGNHVGRDARRRRRMLGRLGRHRIWLDASPMQANQDNAIGSSPLHRMIGREFNRRPRLGEEPDHRDRLTTQQPPRCASLVRLSGPFYVIPQDAFRPRSHPPLQRLMTAAQPEALVASKLLIWSPIIRHRSTGRKPRPWSAPSAFRRRRHRSDRCRSGIRPSTLP